MRIEESVFLTKYANKSRSSSEKRILLVQQPYVDQVKNHPGIGSTLSD